MYIRHINKSKMRKVNLALQKAGYVAYPGDSTTAAPKGCESGYASNLIDHIAGADPDARREVEAIVREVMEVPKE